MGVYHGGDVWRGGAPGDYLDFSANLNPDGAPDWVRAAMEEGLSRAAYYPDRRSAAARRGLSAHLRLPEACVVPTAGGIDAAAMAASLGPAAVVAQPTFQEYAHLNRTSRDVPRGEIDRVQIAPGEALWLCNPNNPTGDALPRDAVESLLLRVEAAGGRLVVDEAFIDYCPENGVADLVEAHPALIVLGSLTKVLAIPGARLGYLAAHPTVARTLAGDAAPWRLNCLADAVAAALPGHEADFERIRRTNAARRERFAESLRTLGARVFPSDANFLLCEFPRDMRPAVDALREKRILVRPCDMFPTLTPRHIRLCVRTDEENARLVEAMKEILSAL